jgi:hypothetical protein
MRFLLYIIGAGIIFGIFSGCNRDESTNLDDDQIIERSAMVQLLADIEITETALKAKQLKLKRDSFNLIKKMSLDSLYIYYNTTPQLFKENLKYYQRDMEDYQKMIDEKIELLSRKKDSISLQPAIIDTTDLNITDSSGLALPDTTALDVPDPSVKVVI